MTAGEHTKSHQVANQIDNGNDDDGNDNGNENDNYEGRTPNSGSTIAMKHVLNDGRGRRACTSNGTQRQALRCMRGHPSRWPPRDQWQWRLAELDS